MTYYIKTSALTVVATPIVADSAQDAVITFLKERPVRDLLAYPDIYLNVFDEDMNLVMHVHTYR